LWRDFSKEEKIVAYFDFIAISKAMKRVGETKRLETARKVWNKEKDERVDVGPMVYLNTVMVIETSLPNCFSRQILPTPRPKCLRAVRILHVR